MPIEPGNQSIKPPIENMSDTSGSLTQNYPVTVRRVSKASAPSRINMNEEMNMPTTSHQDPLSIRAKSSIESGRVHVKKLSRSETMATHEQSKVSSINNVRVRKVKRISSDMLSTNKMQ